jgi:hypothetical protein
MWAILFSPLFSAYLHMKNWQALGHPEEAKIAKLWMIGVGVFFVVLIFLPDDSPVPRMTGIVLLMTWYYSHGKKQIVYVKGHLNNQYVKKSWVVPILVAIATIIALFFVVGLVVTMLGA